MSLKEGIIKWWINKFYATKIIKYEPGYIITEFHNRYGDAFQRLVTLPESMIIFIEDNFIKNSGEEGKKVLAKIGREQGYNFGITIGAPRISTHGKAHVEEYCSFVMKYAMSSWAKESEIIALDIGKEIKVRYDEHLVCKKNGNGVLFTEYMILGFLEYCIEQNMKVVSSTCQGRGDPHCEIEYADGDGDTPNNYFSINDHRKYRYLNQIKKTSNSINSTGIMIKNRNISIDEGKFFYKKGVLFNIECLFLFLLEKYADEIKNGKQILFDAGQEYGKKIGTGENPKYIQDILSGFGYGDVLVKSGGNSHSIIIRNFPYAPIEIKDFALIRGYCSGLLSAVYKKEILLKNSKVVLEANNFSLILS